MNFIRFIRTLFSYAIFCITKVNHVQSNFFAIPILLYIAKIEYNNLNRIREVCFIY